MTRTRTARRGPLSRWNKVLPGSTRDRHQHDDDAEKQDVERDNETVAVSVVMRSSEVEPAQSDEDDQKEDDGYARPDGTPLQEPHGNDYSSASIDALIIRKRLRALDTSAIEARPPPSRRPIERGPNATA